MHTLKPVHPRSQHRRFGARGLRTVVVLILAGASLVAAPVAASAAAIAPPPLVVRATTVGFSDARDFYLGTESVRTHAMSVVKAVGASAVRVLIPWNDVARTKGSYNWTAVDAQIHSAASAGLAVLGILIGSPTWESGAASVEVGTSTPPRNPANFAAFAAVVAARYRGQISAYEVWNEPNSALSWAPLPNPVAYTALLKAAYPAIKRADPTAIVIGGSLGSTITAPGIISPPDFLKTMYASGAHGSFDALSFHPYQFTLNFTDGMTIPNSPLLQVQAMRAQMVRAADGGKKIWATEMGYSTYIQGSEQTASAMMLNFLQSWQQLPFAGPVFLYNPRDEATSPTPGGVQSNPDNNFGIVHSDWTPKVSAYALQAYLAAGAPPAGNASALAGAPNYGYGEIISPVVTYTALTQAGIRIGIPAQFHAGGVEFALPGGLFAGWTMNRYLWNVWVATMPTPN